MAADSAALDPERPTKPARSATSLSDSEKGACLRGRVGELIARAPHVVRTLGLAPPVDFPLQGSREDSEFYIRPPIWARQPFTALYLLYLGLSLSFIRIPLWAVSCLAPRRRGHPSWSWSRAMIVRIARWGSKATFRTHIDLGRDLAEAVPHSATKYSNFVWVPPVPADLIRGELDSARFALQGMRGTAKVPGFWFGEHVPTAPRTAPPQAQGRDLPVPTPPPQLLEYTTERPGGSETFAPAEEDEQVLLHFHGGAYWIGTAHERDFTSGVTHEALGALRRLYNGKRGRCRRSFSVDYRLCKPNRPELGSWPAPLLDAVAGYLYLVRTMGFQPRNVVVVGDSAGGNLALALCRYLRDEGIAEVPGRLLLLAPWVDVSRSHSGPRHAPNAFSSVVRNRNSDIIHPSTEFRNMAVNTLLGNLPARETYTNPYLSPASLQLPLSQGGAGPHYGFERFPAKTFIITGTAEVSYDSHVTLAHRMAMGTLTQRPLYRGDQCCAQLDPVQLATRPSYPRPASAEVDLTPTAGVPLVHNEEELNPLVPTLLEGGYSSATELTKRVAPTSSRASCFCSSGRGTEMEELEEREVVLYEALGGVHEYPLLPFWEPDKTRTWTEVARWIEQD